MTKRIVRPPVVELDLAQIADFIGQQSPEAGLRFLTAAEEAFQKLAAMPEMGSLCVSPNPRLAGLRVWPIAGFPNHLVFYRPAANGIEVVRVLHAARDIESLFGS